MEMEMGLKLTRAADEFSSAEFQFAKDRGGPLFQSTETDTMFILTVHLKGYIQKNIKIDIDEEGTIIAIRGEKQVQETVMLGWKLIKKDVEIRKFSKAFKIPDGVILDKVKARFDEEKSILTVKMPKKVKGILGIEFVEVKDHELVKQDSSEDLPIVADNMPKKVTFKDEKAEENQEKKKEIVQNVLEDHQVNQEKDLQSPVLPSSISKPREEVEKHVVNDEIPQMEKELTPNVDSNIQNNNDPIPEIRQPEYSSSKNEPKDDQISERANGISEKEDNVPKKSSKICVPIVAGSALILSLVVFVIHFLRTKNQSGKRKG